MKEKVKIHPSWLEQLEDEFNKPYMQELKSFLAAELKKGKTIYPHGDHIFEAFNQTPWDQVKAVIIGQDPYHGPGQAHGLCFSVKPEVPLPPSLKNIYQELKTDLNIDLPNHGYLESWAKEGVLMLNQVLTVERGKAASHHQKGWENFTDKVVELLNEKKQDLVFILWGSPAQKKAAKVDASKHFLVKSVHPSPLSAYRGFFGSKPFSKCNHYLEQKSISPINWNPKL